MKGVSPHWSGRFATNDLARTSQRESPLELLDGQKPERIPHDDRGTAAKVVPIANPPAPSKSECERGEPEIGFGLAASRWVPEEVCDFSIVTVRVDQARDCLKDESELEGSPLGRGPHIAQWFLATSLS